MGRGREEVETNSHRRYEVTTCRTKPKASIAAAIEIKISWTGGVKAAISIVRS
jgi:hypothetical protein